MRELEIRFKRTEAADLHKILYMVQQSKAPCELIKDTSENFG